MLAGCGRTPAKEQSEKSELAPSQQQSALQAIPPTALLQGSQEKTAVAGTQKAMPKDVIMLKGAALGAVKFEHKLHTARTANCETCHHPSKQEKPNAAPQQACSDCHTKVAKSPMKTKLQAAFHNPTAAAGTCIDCHKAETAKGKVAPMKCMGCHKKEKV
jgi:hypothetical protein